MKQHHQCKKRRDVSTKTRSPQLHFHSKARQLSTHTCKLVYLLPSLVFFAAVIRDVTQLSPRERCVTSEKTAAKETVPNTKRFQAVKNGVVDAEDKYLLHQKYFQFSQFVVPFQDLISAIFPLRRGRSDGTAHDFGLLQRFCEI